MNRTRLVRLSSVAVIVMMAGCGSAGRPGHGSMTPTASPANKLNLASAGEAATPSAVAGAPAIVPEQPTTYVLDATLRDLGASAIVWRMNAHTPSVSDVQRFAAALGLAGTPTRTSTGWEVPGTNSNLTFFISDSTVGVSYGFGVPNAAGGSTGAGGAAVGGGGLTNPASKAEPPGTVIGPSPVPAVPTVPPPVDVPSAGEAQNVARGLLDHLGVLAGQHWSTDVTDTGGIAVSCPAGLPCPTIPPQVFARTVTFSLMLDGMRVDGVDWSVTIGEHRRIESLMGAWASPVPIGSYPLLTTIAAFTDLQHGNARYTGPQPMTTSAGTPLAEAAKIGTPPTTASVVVHITGVSLGIARWGAYLQAQTALDLVPTYRFHANSDGATAYDIEILALNPGAITFSHPAPTPKPLAPQPAPSAAPASSSALSRPSS
jgi:hypothetical protein